MAQVLTEVVKLPNVGIPPIRISGIEIEGTESVRIRFETTAPPSLFEFVLEQAADLAGLWREEAAEAQETEAGHYFLLPRDGAQKQQFYRVKLRRM
ncbi:MAG: hypothetical protein ACI9R3_001278 [Verrucomicrobiales bacterium]|jgi:hypothetical protein